MTLIRSYATRGQIILVNTIGVTKTRLGYVAEVSLLGTGRWRSKVVYSIEEAMALYWQKKSELAMKLAEQQSDKRIANALINLFTIK